jgi:aldehyde dehydrogenase (NAD+)
MARIAVFNPANGEQIADVADGGQAAVDEAVAKARASFEAGVWRHKPDAERARILWRVAELIERDAADLAATESRNTGQSVAYAQNLVRSGAELFRYYAGWCTKTNGMSSDLRIGGPGGAALQFHAYTVMEPVGVAGLIIPWNGPFYCAAMKLAPALAAGCSCVLKPAEQTPLTSLMLERIMLEAGIPEGVVQVVTGYGATTGAAMARHRGVDKIAFTGSTATGKEIVNAVTGNLKRVTLELGGKSPVIVFDDADLARAAPFLAGGVFNNSGQVCSCGSRIYVKRSVFDQVAEAIVAAARAHRLGGGDDTAATMGPLISARQRDRVAGIVDEGRQQGASVLTGGNAVDRPGFFFEPTIVTGTRPEMRLIREEIFGPVGSLIPFDDEEEVMIEANDTEYGLAATVWTQDIGRAHRLARRLQAGTVWLNCRMADSSMPLGGFKQSGWGYEMGWKGLETYLQTKTIYAGL